MRFNVTEGHRKVNPSTLEQSLSQRIHRFLLRSPQQS